MKTALFLALLFFPLSVCAASDEAEKIGRWKAVLDAQAEIMNRSADYSLEQLKELLFILDELQRTADMDLRQQEKVLQLFTKGFGAIRTVYAQRISELETPPNVFSNGAEFAVTNYDDNIKVKYDFMEPKQGFQFLAVFVEVVNKSKRSVYIGKSYFVIKDQRGQVFTCSSDRAEPELQSTDLEPGDRLSGWVTYEVPWDDYKEKMRIRFDGGRGRASRWVPLWE